MSAVSEQLITVTDSTSAIECPICMEPIEALYNRVVTECGHAFHCACLMQNAAHNGFRCPYCRTNMANEPEEEEEDDDYRHHIADDITVFDEDALTSFRMFHQQINGEEVEEEPAEEWDSIDEEYEETTTSLPDYTYITQKLIERGITMEDLVKNILYGEHSNWGQHYNEYERRSMEVYGQFRIIISQYTRTSASTEPAELNFQPLLTQK